MNFVVIGAARGLGFCLTEQLLKAGHRVAAGVRNHSEKLEPLQSRYPDALLAVEADVTDEAQTAQAAQKAEAFFGPADAVCNAAGILLDGDRVNLLHQCDIGELRRTLNVNTAGAVVVAKCFYPHMKKGGRLFTVTSEGVGVKSCGTWVPCYGLSKTAATKVSGILNASVEDVDFYSVHPGRMNTDMGRTTAQIEPEEAAEGIARLMSGETAVSREHWYIDYLGRALDA